MTERRTGPPYSRRMSLMSAPTLDVCEVFESISGESSSAGRPAIFVRLSGCNLRCAWCDTVRAWQAGQTIELDRLLGLLDGRNRSLVIVTGGEPLVQPHTSKFCQALLDAGYQVQVETNGSLDISVLPQAVDVVLDMKAPSSGESERMDLANLARLSAGDDLKIIIANRADFEWAEALVGTAKLPKSVNIFLSAAFQLLDPGKLATWLLESQMHARLQVQVHRILWPDGSDGRALDLT
jgi:7-carboxy-7-deazaguanine synthase